MSTASTGLTPEQLSAVRASAAGRRAHAVVLRWEARCEEMEAVLDDLAVALLPRPEITHLVGSTCEGIDCRYDKGFAPTDHDVFAHLHFDAVVVAAGGTLVLGNRTAVPAGVRAADLEEDHEGIHPDSLGWAVRAPYRTTPPAGFEETDDEVWLDAGALRARVGHLLAPLIGAPVSGGRVADARTATLDARLDELASALRDCWRSEDVYAIGFQRCEDEECFAPEETSYAHVHPVTALARDETGRVDTIGGVLTDLPEDLLADDADWSIPDLYRTIPTHAAGIWVDPDADIWIHAAALSARAQRVGTEPGISSAARRGSPATSP